MNVKIPCKIGDVVYTIVDCENPFVADGNVESISIQEDGFWIFARYSCGLTYWHKVDDKNLFFDKKKANIVAEKMRLKEESYYNERRNYQSDEQERN